MPGWADADRPDASLHHNFFLSHRCHVHGFAEDVRQHGWAVWDRVVVLLCGQLNFRGLETPAEDLFLGQDSLSDGHVFRTDSKACCRVVYVRYVNQRQA